MEGLGITFAAASFTGTLFDATSASTLTAVDLAMTVAVTGTVFGAAAIMTLILDSCQILTKASGVVFSAVLGDFVARDSSLGVSDALTALSGGAIVSTQTADLYGCQLHVVGASSSRVIIAATSSIRASGTRVICSGGGTCTVFDSDDIFETGTDGRLGNAAVTYYAIGAGASQACHLGSRDVDRGLDQTNADPLSIPGTQYRSVTVRTTDASGWAGNCNVNISEAPHGSDLLLLVWNDTAAPTTYVWGTGVSIAGATTFTVAANSVRSFLLASSVTNASPEWFLVADVAGAEVVE
jgi:hypothetical protein